MGKSNYDGIRQVGKDKEGKTVWEVNLRYTDPMTGEPKREWHRFHGSKRDARRHREELLRERESGISVQGSEAIVFRELAEQWHESRVESGGLAPDTLERDSSLMRICCSYIGNVPVRDLNPYRLQLLYSSLEHDRTLRPATMRKYHAFISCVMNFAVRQRYINDNPERYTDRPRSESTRRRSLDPEEIPRFCRAVDGSEKDAYNAFAGMHRRKDGPVQRMLGLNSISRIMAVRIGFATGARRGEVLALTWGCVDTRARRIRICKSLTKKGDVKGTKTKAGNRIISIDAETSGHLAQWKEFQGRCLSKLGGEQGPETPVVCNQEGTFMKPSNFSRWWKQWAEGAGFTGLAFHDLRHTHATQLLAQGMDIKTVQARGGWSTASVMLDIYAHDVPQNDRDAADIVERIIRGSGGEKRCRIIPFSA